MSSMKKSITVSKARTIIQQLNRMNLDITDYAYIKSLTDKLVIGLPMTCITPHKDTRFYRGIIYKEKPTIIDCLGYPPSEIIVNYQRCNPPGKPMFYCSPDPAAVYYELGVQPGDVVYMSKWSVTEDFFVNQIPSTYDDTENNFGKRYSNDIY